MSENELIYPVLSDEYIDKVLKTGPLNVTLSGAEQFTQDIAGRISHPSEYGVNEMRNWSITNEK